MKKLIVLAFAMVMVSASAFADLRNPQVSVDNSASLQSILNTIYGAGSTIQAVGSQQTAQTWYLPGTNPSAIPALFATNASDADAVGLYSGSSLLQVFSSTAPVGATAAITFNSDGSIDIGSSVLSNCTNGYVNCGHFTTSGVLQNNFGFYLQDGANFYYTEDSRNGGDVRALSYVDTTSNRWAIAFNDAGTDHDYDDRVISVESIVSTPEPASIMLLGVGLLGFGRKLFKK